MHDYFHATIFPQINFFHQDYQINKNYLFKKPINFTAFINIT